MIMQLRDVPYRKQPMDIEKCLGQLNPSDASTPTKKELSGDTASELINDLFS